MTVNGKFLQCAIHKRKTVLLLVAKQGQYRLIGDGKTKFYNTEGVEIDEATHWALIWNEVTA